MHLTSVAFVAVIPVLQSRGPAKQGHPRRQPRFQIRAQKSATSVPPAADSDVQKPPLPSSSKGALTSAVLLWLSAVGVPASLALRDATETSTPFVSHLSNYGSHYQVILFATLFGFIHSGLASLRPIVTKYTGQRLYRVVFALASIPSAVGLISYFIAHRYDGAQLWQLQGVPHMHDAVFALTALSFAFLYPATFNLLEVAAVQKPSFKIYETGIMRLTRHPQLAGQVMWCIAHTAWMGTSFSLTASLVLVAHHCFGAWNGDRRLRDAYGDEWVKYAARTSVLPLVAVLDGRQKLEIREFLRWAYVGVALAVWGFYAAHPVVLRLIGDLHL